MLWRFGASALSRPVRATVWLKVAWIRPSGAFMAVGYGGQLLYVDRERDAVVVVLSSEAGKGADWDRRLLGVIERDLLPALQGDAAEAPASQAESPAPSGPETGSRPGPATSPASAQPPSAVTMSERY